MKRIAWYLMVIVLSAVTFTACSPDSEFEKPLLPEPEFDVALLIGKWKSNIAPTTEYFRYDAMGTGVTWDTSDDVTEAEGQAFTWMLDQEDLTQIHIIEVGNGNSVTKKYTVTELTAATLKYKDSTKSYSFTKINK